MSSIPPSLDDRDGKIWMDGELVDWRDAKIHVLSHTLHYGCGAFEGVRAYKTPEGTAIFRLAEHTERLFNSAKILRMKIPFSQEQLNEAQKQVVRENKLESCYLRPLIWIGSEKLGVSPKGNRIHAMVAAWSWGAYLGEEGLRRGIRVKTSSYTRHHVNITMTQAKSVSNYTNSILANMEALDDGYDEALLLDASGFVSEGAGENIFVVKGGVVYTPDLSAGALNGITRNTILHICKDLGIELVQKRITRDEVYICGRGLLHRHGRRSDADSRARPHRDRQPRRRRLARPDHRENPVCLLRHRERQEPQVRPLAHESLNNPCLPMQSSNSWPRSSTTRAACSAPAPRRT
jgi:branched-chain amino acid aminotransferase